MPCEFTLPKVFSDVYDQMVKLMKSGKGVAFGVMETYGFMQHLYMYNPEKGYYLYKVSDDPTTPMRAICGQGKWDKTLSFGHDEYLMMRDMRRALRNASGAWMIWDPATKTLDRQCDVHDLTFAYEDFRVANPKVSCAVPSKPVDPPIPVQMVPFPRQPLRAGSEGKSTSWWVVFLVILALFGLLYVLGSAHR
jgi:hypothetical protein